MEKMNLIAALNSRTIRAKLLCAAVEAANSRGLEGEEAAEEGGNAAETSRGKQEASGPLVTRHVPAVEAKQSAFLERRKYLEERKPSRQQLGRPLMLAARYRIAGRRIPTRVLEAVSAPETITGFHVTPEGYTNSAEKHLEARIADEATQRVCAYTSRLSAHIKRSGGAGFEEEDG
ncbi:hypothetical protein Efla_003925 [Eimeria flavescens]